MTDLPDSKLAELAEAAGKATPSPWRVFESEHPGIEGDDGKSSIVIFGDAGEFEGVRRPEDADYIAAADPTTLLALVEELRRRRAEAARAVRTAARFGVEGDPHAPA